METKATCPNCGVGCGVLIEHDGARITGVRGDPAHPAGVTGRPIEGERPTPIDADQYDSVQPERVEPGVEIAGVVGEAVRQIGLARAPHPNQIGREQPTRRTDPGQHPPPEV